MGKNVRTFRQLKRINASGNVLLNNLNLGGGRRRSFGLAEPSQQKGTRDIFTKISASEHVFSDHNRQA
jgi:hypothetical protein